MYCLSDETLMLKTTFCITVEFVTFLPSPSSKECLATSSKISKFVRVVYKIGKKWLRLQDSHPKRQNKLGCLYGIEINLFELLRIQFFSWSMTSIYFIHLRLSTTLCINWVVDADPPRLRVLTFWPSIFPHLLKHCSWICNISTYSFIKSMSCKWLEKKYLESLQ